MSPFSRQARHLRHWNKDKANEKIKASLKWSIFQRHDGVQFPNMLFSFLVEHFRREIDPSAREPLVTTGDLIVI